VAYTRWESGPWYAYPNSYAHSPHVVYLCCRHADHANTDDGKPLMLTIPEVRKRIKQGDTILEGTNLAAVFAAFLAEYDRKLKPMPRQPCPCRCVLLATGQRCRWRCWGRRNLRQQPPHFGLANAVTAPDTPGREAASVDPPLDCAGRDADDSCGFAASDQVRGDVHFRGSWCV